MSNRRKPRASNAYRSEFLSSPAWFARRARWFRKQERLDRPLACAGCGWPATRDQLELHHLDYRGVRFVDERLMARLGITAQEFARIEARERGVLDERVGRIRTGHPPLDLTGRTAVIVDDGIATGATAVVASRAARARGASRIVVAAPVVSADAVARLAEADRVTGLLEPDDLIAVGAYYRRFDQTDDAEVDALLDAARDV